MKKLKKNILLLITTLLVTVTALSQATPVFADSINITSQPSGVISTGYFEAVNSRGWALFTKSWK